ncbi:MAG TPA: orotate phosphoribosyltransferase [Pseudomonadales bacterium]|jgi:orotate phosphoribosyltransferase
MHDYQTRFIAQAIASKALRFGDFTLKSGRKSPYFFNAGAFDDGQALSVQGQCYAAAIAAEAPAFDVLFGPAYKGIPLAAVTAQALFEQQARNVPYCFNRKEAKTHGEGGRTVGAPLQGRVLLVDDVMTAGTAIREVTTLIREAGAEPVGVVIGLDRQERGQGDLSAVQEVSQSLGVPVISLIRLDDILSYLSQDSALREHIPAMQAYRETWGVR